jgi:hypothetical protein
MGKSNGTVLESAPKQPAEHKADGQKWLHRLLRMIDESGWWVTRAWPPKPGHGQLRASRSAARFSSRSAYLLTRALAAASDKPSPFVCAPRERATFASFFLEIEAHAIPRANQPNSQRERLHGVMQVISNSAYAGALLPGATRRRSMDDSAIDTGRHTIGTEPLTRV